LNSIVTYSPAYTIVPTYDCFNRCRYCNFRTNLGESPWLTLPQTQQKLEALQGSGVWEILVLSGEIHPHSPQRQAWFNRIYDICQLALDMGFLPHTNVGILHYEEMAQLKQVNVSMGLMLEQLTPKLLETVHRHAPSKIPQLRLQQLEWAGQLKIPFTTGILLGIGETEADWWDSLDAIAQIHDRWGHIQEVILQPHSPGEKQVETGTAFDPYQLPQVIRQARQILPDSMTLQVPPNLVPEFHFLLDCLEAGATDIGGISPFDEVNPDYPHPKIEQLRDQLAKANWQLVERLPVYPQYYDQLPDPLQQALKLVSGL
jgi:FO synthase subunit 1